MALKSHLRPVTTHHRLLGDAWTADVLALEKSIGAFAPPSGDGNTYHVSFFEMDSDPYLHVNVIHRQPTRSVRGWSGPGVLPDGFIHNRTFNAGPTAHILRSIRQMVFAARA
jgi:hypothetical protein